MNHGTSKDAIELLSEFSIGHLLLGMWPTLKNSLFSQ